MTLSELCIRRPAMTVLLSLSVVAAGALAYRYLPIAALPSFNTPIILVSADLPGAGPESMASSVATPLEKQFSTIPGIAVMSSTSFQGTSDFTLEFEPGRNIDAAAVDVQAAILRAQRSLPPELTQPPAYRKVNPADAPILLLAITSPSISLPDLDDFAENLIAPSLSTLTGVAQVTVFGQKKYAVRVDVDPKKLAARNLTLDDLAKAIDAANSNSPLGILRGPHQTLVLETNKQLRRAAQFAPLIVATNNGAPVYLSDVATLEDGIESTTTASWINNETAIVLSVLKQPDANTVATVDAIRATLPRIISQMPGSVKIQTLNDRSASIRNAVNDVQVTLLITAALVVLVIFLFLRHLSATLIPSVTLPISLIGALALMYWLGYSLDNISLLGLTLSVGLVVDDAIVVLENIVRHIEAGEGPIEAAIKGASEVTFTIISISLSLVAVFIPIFFMPGVIGLLFHEFAVVVMLAVLVSAVVSLTLIPLMATRLLKPAHEQREYPLLMLFERGFEAVQGAYQRSLELALRHRRIVLAVALATFVGSGYLFVTIPKGFFPQEDIGQIQGVVQPSNDASVDSVAGHLHRISTLLLQDPAVDSVVASVNDNAGRLFINLKSKTDRPPMPILLDQLRKAVANEPGADTYLQAVQNLRLGGRISKSQYQYVLQSVNGGELNSWADKLQQTLARDQRFRDVSTDSQLNGLDARVEVDRERANLYGVSLADVRSALFSAFGDRNVSNIYTASGSYEVILEVAAPFRQDETSIGQIQVRSKDGQLVPLSNLAHISRVAGPTAVNHSGQLPAITVSFSLAPGATLGEATQLIDAWQTSAGLPSSILAAYAGEAAAFQQTQSTQFILIIAAVLVIYVLLGVLYESYIHPLTILSGLPSAAIGALLTLELFGLQLTVIASIGILMLIGIVKKNAIMMIDFALKAQRAGKSPEDAIRQACVLRFRPITMTTLAAMMGALPLAVGIGAGSELRQPLGVAVVGGLIFSQAITLYITPVLFLYLESLRKVSRRTSDPGGIAAASKIG
jgi:HAE1 family hydrophobic/amphiphilic exporter-1